MHKFVIISHARSGSNLMVRSLNAHPQVCCFGEVLKPGLRFQDLDRLGFEESQLSDLRYTHQHGTASFADLLFDQAANAGYEAVGFKLFYYHAREAGRDSSIWDAVAKRDEWRFIHLYRANIFGAYLSRQLAIATNSWHHGSGRTDDSDYQTKIAVDLDDYRAFHGRLKKSIEDARKMLPEGRTITTTYEDFTSDFALRLRGLQEFLEVNPQDTSPPLVKQARRPWQEYVLNAAEVEEALHDTRLDGAAPPD